jgi:protein SCO1/2
MSVLDLSPGEALARRATAPPSTFALVGFFVWLAASIGWWVLAFAPLPMPAEWLEQARAVCFGSPPGGLPDTWGWMVLVLGPLSLLAFLLAVWAADLKRWTRRFAGHPAGMVVLAALALAPAAFALWLGNRVAAVDRAGEAAVALAAPEGDRLPEGWPRIAEPAPALGLLDQTGSRLDLAALAGKPTLLTFAYAHCATMCPVLVTSLRRAANDLGPRATAVVVTLDPWRDTPSALPTLLQTWGLAELPAVHLLSGSVDEVVAVHESYGVTGTRDEQTGEITHPGLVFVLDGEGRIAYRFLSPPASWLVDAVTRLEREAA